MAARKKWSFGPKRTTKIDVIANMKKMSERSGPQIVKSELVNIAYTVIPITDPAVMHAAARTISG